MKFKRVSYRKFKAKRYIKKAFSLDDFFKTEMPNFRYVPDFRKGVSNELLHRKVLH